MTTLILNSCRINHIKKILVISALFFLLAHPAMAQNQSEEKNMDNPFGVLEFLHWNHAWNNFKYPTQTEMEKAVKLMKEAGVGWARIDFLWQDIEPEEGCFEFEKYDQIVEVLTKNKINILGLLNYSTDWASSCGKWNCPPKDNSLFVKYALKVIGRYKDKVKYWEVWNEPDSAVYWSEQDGLKSYCTLLKDVYIAAKKLDPDCKILNGGFANGLGSVHRLYDNGAKDYFDILNIHFFENPFNPVGIKAVAAFPKLVYKVMSRNNDGQKKIWITEIGCPGVSRWAGTKNWWMGKNPTERQQAEWVRKVYTELLKDGNIEKIFWAFFRDTKEHWGSGVDYFGLIRWNYSKKASYNAYRDAFKNWKKR